MNELFPAPVFPITAMIGISGLSCWDFQSKYCIARPQAIAVVSSTKIEDGRIQPYLLDLRIFDAEQNIKLVIGTN
jgi:hypothetical protein